MRINGLVYIWPALLPWTAGSLSSYFYTHCIVWEEVFALLFSFSTQKLEEAAMPCQLGLQWFIDGLGCSRGRSPTLAPSPASQDISRNISSAYRRHWC